MSQSGDSGQVFFKPHISEKSERLGDSALKIKLKDFKGSHADYLIAEAQRINAEREAKLKIKQEEELKTLQQKPDIPSLAKYTNTKRAIN